MSQQFVIETGTPFPAASRVGAFGELRKMGQTLLNAYNNDPTASVFVAGESKNLPQSVRRVLAEEGFTAEARRETRTGDNGEPIHGVRVRVTGTREPLAKKVNASKGKSAGAGAAKVAGAAKAGGKAKAA